MLSFWALSVRAPRSRAGASFLLLAVAGLLCAQQTTAATSQTHVVKSSASKNVPQVSSVEIINGTSREIRNFNTPQTTVATPRHSQSPASGTRVEVINGTTERTVVLNAQPAAGGTAVRKTAAAHRSQRNQKDRTSQVTAEIINGTRMETRVFSAPSDPFDGSDSVRRNAHPVVVGIQSSESISGSEHRKPVVIGIASSGSQSQSAQPVVLRVAENGSARSEGNAQPVVVGIESSGMANGAGDVRPVAVDVAPRTPKRPPYRRPTSNP
jgi:hypothetical protein